MNKLMGLFLLFMALTSVFAQSIALVSPADGFSTLSKSNSFSYYYNSSGSDYDKVACDLLIDGSSVAST